MALRTVDPTIIQEMRYFTAHNFVGKRIDGYQQPICLLTRPAAEALHQARLRLLRKGYTLKVYDCYRPQRAVNHFVRWAEDLDDQAMKGEFYPNVDKTRLFEDGYIAEKSGHSRDSTMDLTIGRLPAKPTRNLLRISRVQLPKAPCAAHRPSRLLGGQNWRPRVFNCRRFSAETSLLVTVCDLRKPSDVARRRPPVGLPR